MAEKDDDAPTLADPPKPRTTRAYGAPAVTLGDSVPHVADLGPLENLTRYRLGEVLGRGGMGEVVSARDDHIGRSVAIKRLRSAAPTPDVLARFLREARIQGRLEHPAVVPVHELWYENGLPFFTMKQLAGTTLSDVIPRLAARDPEAQATFSRQRLLRAFAEVCLAIEFAHTRGVIHRDLKPSNIMLGDFGEVYVLDWGVARVTTEQGDLRASFADIDSGAGGETVAGSILGTPGYISPEQIRADPDLDARADVYSLGCILFEILALQPLHPRGGAGIASALGGTADARVSVRTGDVESPPELDRICVRATAVDRAERFPTARELGDAVQRFLDGNRDVALRKELARAELANARAALAGDEEQRREAMRSAARAIALDPTEREAAEIVGRLMLEPPKHVPPEVVDEIGRLDHDALRKSAIFGIFGARAMLGFFPVLYWIGFRELWQLGLGTAIALTIIVVDLTVVRRSPKWASRLAITGFLLLFALLSTMLSPLIIGPGPAVLLVTITISANRTIARPWVLAIFAWLATLAPWFLDVAGVVDTRTTISQSDIILHTTAESLAVTPSLIAIGLYVVCLIHLATLMTRLQDDVRRDQRRALQLQAWQLRQLVPRTPVA